MKDYTPLSVAYRNDLLTRAIELCSSLNAVLDLIGPSRFVKSLATDIQSPFEDVCHRLLELSRLEDSLNRKLQAISEARNAVLAPILRLPDDVLRHIFTLPLSSNAFADRHWPLRLSLVCRNWWAVAHHTANIWTFLTIPPSIPRSPLPNAWGGKSLLTHPWYDHMRVDASASVDAAHFLLSKAAPLSVSILVFDKELISSQVDWFVANCASRVHRLRIAAAENTDVTKVLMPCLYVTRLVLRHLEVTFTSVGGAHLNEAVFFVEQFIRTDMPLLTDLVLQNMPIPMNGGETYLAFSTCKRIVVSTHKDQFLGRNDLVRLLQSCANVRNLRLYIPGMLHSTRTDSVFQAAIRADDRVHMLKLDTLIVTAPPEAPLPISIIRAPSLAHLRLQQPIRNDSWPPELLTEIYEFLTVSAPPLKSLFAMGLSADSIVTILQLAPSIKSLSVLAPHDAPEDYVNLLRLLNNPDYSEAAWPGPFLERLAFLGVPMMPDHAIFQELPTLLRNRNLNQVTGSSAIRQLEFSSRGAPASPEKTRLLEEQLAAEVESLIVRHGAWEGATTWKYDRAAREWKRDVLTNTWEA